LNTINIITIFKAVPLHATEALGGKRSSYSFLTSAVDGGEWSVSRPVCALPQGKDPRYPFYRRLGGPQPVWTQRLEEKSFSITVLQTETLCIFCLLPWKGMAQDFFFVFLKFVIIFVIERI
jgi:hypothetical protein